MTQDQIYRYFKHQKIPSENEDLFKKQEKQAGKTFVLRFKHKWLKDNSWHVYSKELKGGLCKVCILFDKADEINRGIFVKRAYQDLNKPEKVLEQHAQAEYHNDPMIRAQQFIDSYENPTENINYDPNMQTRYEKNTQIFMRIIDAVLICARQEIVLRTRRYNLDNPFVRDSNFIAILKGFANMDDTLKNHLENGPKSTKLCSAKIQNEIIACIAKFVRMKFKNIMEKTKYFSIIADEVTDRYSNNEVLLLCLRYLNIDRKIGVPVIEKTFLDSNHIQGRPTGKVIGNHKLLADHGFDVKDYRGQAYDAAAVMSSQTKGASSVIKNEQPLADWVHCRNHCINLAIAFACKNTSVTHFMDSLTSACYYFANSPKRQQYFERFIDYYKEELSVAASSRSHVIGLFKPRWVERYKAYENYYLLFKFIVATFDSICNPYLYKDFYKYLENETIENWCWDSESTNKA